jgi:O-antigen/teichoic acid export membrane protein
MRDGQRVAVNTLVMLAKQAMLAVLSVAFVGYMARKLGVAAWGEFQASLAIVMVVTIVAGIGVRGYLAREIAVRPELGPDHLGSALLIRGVTGLVVLLITVLVALSTRSVGGVLVTIAAVSQLTTLLYSTMWLSFEAHERFQYILYAELGARLFVTSVASALLALGYGVIAAALAFLGGNVLELVLTYIFVVKKLYRPRYHVDPRALYTIAKAALPIGVLGAIATAMQQSDRVMLRILSGDAAVGVYSAAWVLSENFNLISDLFLGAAFAAAMRLFANDRPAFARLYQSCMLVAAILGFPIAAGLYLIAPELIQLIYGRGGYSASAHVLQILACQLPLTFAFQVGTLPLLAQKRELDLAKLLAAGLVANVLLNLALIPRFGPTGSAMATLVVAAGTLLGSSRLSEVWVRQLEPRRFASVAGATLVMALAAWSALRWLNMWAAIGAGIIAYVGALLLLRALTWNELLDFLRRDPSREAAIS